MAQNRDLMLLARQWEIVEIPKEKKYLLKYFKTPLQVAFLKYIYVFGDYSSFVDHTGIPCRTFWLEELFSRFENLEKIRTEARTNMDLPLLALIESGKYKF